MADKARLGDILCADFSHGIKPELKIRQREP